MPITLNGTTGIDLSGTTTGVVTASWTTAGRPATPATGEPGLPAVVHEAWVMPLTGSKTIGIKLVSYKVLRSS